MRRLLAALLAAGLAWSPAFADDDLTKQMIEDTDLCINRLHDLSLCMRIGQIVKHERELSDLTMIKVPNIMLADRWETNCVGHSASWEEYRECRLGLNGNFNAMVEWKR